MLLPTPPPAVTAAGAVWQINGEPIFYEGAFYYPAGPSVFFDGNAMARTGVYRGVPLYQDRTLVPYSIVFVPIGGTVMRPYERRREGELAGTTGSRTPSFPVQPSSGPVSGLGVVGFQSPPINVEPPHVPEATSGSVPGADALSALVRSANVPRATVPRAGAGRAEIWFDFDGARWYKTGAAVDFDPNRFVPVGNHEGLIVYRSKADPSTLYLTIVPDGPLVPFGCRSESRGSCAWVLRRALSLKPCPLYFPYSMPFSHERRRLLVRIFSVLPH
jgi:hypothetical protein